MPITTIDATAALLVIDLQRGTTAARMSQPIDDVIANAIRLVGAFRHHRLPIVLARHDPALTPRGRVELGGGLQPVPQDYSELVDGIRPESGDLVLMRGTWSAFTGTGLHERLMALGITQVVIAGVATSFGVESTARAAHDLGYDVVTVSDAVADRTPEAHERALTGVLRILGETGSVGEVLARLDA